MVNEIPYKNKFRHIIISDETYQNLRNHGKLGDTFNDVVKRLLERESIIDVDEKLEKITEEYNR
jgi:predicted CopG family antitoxin